MRKALAIFLLIFLATTVNATIQYRVIDLGTLGGTESMPSAINDNGQVVGFSLLSGDQEGRATLFDTTGAGNNISLGDGIAESINNSGQIVGWGGHATLYDITGQGNNIDLHGATEASVTHAESINNSGQIVGFYYSPMLREAIIIDPTGSGNHIPIGGLGADPNNGGFISDAYDINDNGQIVGGAGLLAGNWHAVIFDSTGAGNNIDLTPGENYSEAYDINNHGKIVGMIDPGSFDAYAVLFDETGDGNNINLGTGGGYESIAYAINDNGVIVGKITNGPDGFEGGAAILDQTGEGNNVMLNDVIDPDSGCELWAAIDINNSGQILAEGLDHQGKFHGFLLNPVTNYHVDGAGGDNGNDGLTRETAFETIQFAIDNTNVLAHDTVLVWPGVYEEAIDFGGKAITVKSADEPAVLRNPSGFAVSFYNAEGDGSVVENFIIAGGLYGIQVNGGCSPTLRNLTIANNDFGITCYEDAAPDVSNCIFYNNSIGDMDNCTPSYSCFAGAADNDNIDADPLFANAGAGDYHLLGRGGRFDPGSDTWVKDVVSSPCIDTGDPASDASLEPEHNGYRINMGAYGGTSYATIGPSTLYVSDAGGDDSDDGVSWATAFATIQRGIDVAINYDVVIVADGTYIGDGNRDLDYNGKRITVRSLNGPDNCIIDPQGTGAEPHRGFYFHNGEDPNSLVEGFTITNGFGLFNADIFPDSSIQYFGGGIYCESSSPIINNCVFLNNTVSDAFGASGAGGGVFFNNCSVNLSNSKFINNWNAVSLEDCNGTISGCEFTEDKEKPLFSRNSHINILDSSFTENLGYMVIVISPGYPILPDSSSANIINCVISNNLGTAIYAPSTTGLIDNCVITNNKAGEPHAGAIDCYDGSDIDITNCFIDGNEGATDEVGGIAGCNGAISNCVISNNIGGGLLDCNGSITNCTIVNNSGGVFWGANGLASCNGSITNTIFWGNADYYAPFPELTQAQISDSSVPTYSCIQDWSGGGIGNITTDPNFALTEDYHLMPGSPCIDAGTNDPNGGLTAFDLDGTPRLLDGDNNGTSTVDIGAYEYTSGLPCIAISPKTVEFFVGENNPVSGTQSFSIRNSGDQPLYWEVTADVGWIVIESTSSGTNIGEIDTVSFTVDGTGMPAGYHTGTITVSDSTAFNNPQQITVIMHVGTTIYVPQDYPTIQAAVNAAITNDTVVVAEGTYVENIVLGNENIILTSTDPDNPDTVAATIIDGNQSASVVTFSSTVSNIYKLTGFTITNGNSFDGGGVEFKGAGYQTVISNCVIKYNTAFIGGGIYGCEIQGTAMAIMDCKITGNSATYGGGISGFHGLITNCTISANESTYHAGGIERCDGTITNCIISGNSTGIYGGGIDDCYADITNCTITGNSASDGGGLSACTGKIANCIIWGNTATNDDNQIYFGPSGSTPTYSCIQDWTGGGLGNITADPLFIDDSSSDPNLLDYHLKSEGWYWDAGRQIWDYDSVTSPCIDAGNPSTPLGDELLTVPADPDNTWGVNVRANMGAYSGTAEASMPPHGWMYLADINNDGAVNLTDFASQAQDWMASGSQQPGDLSRDGTVDLADLLLMADDWLNVASWVQ